MQLGFFRKSVNQLLTVTVQMFCVEQMYQWKKEGKLLLQLFYNLEFKKTVVGGLGLSLWSVVDKINLKEDHLYSTSCVSQAVVLPMFK